MSQHLSRHPNEDRKADQWAAPRFGDGECARHVCLLKQIDGSCFETDHWIGILWDDFVGSRQVCLRFDRPRAAGQNHGSPEY